MVSSELSAQSTSLNLVPHRPATLKEQAALDKSIREVGIVVDMAMKDRLRRQGFDFDDEMDNRSMFSEKDLFPAFAKHMEPKVWKPNKKALKHAIRSAYSAFGRKEHEEYLTPANYEQIEAEINPNASSGLPYMEPKADSFAKDVGLSYKVLLGKRRPPPCFPFHRTGFGATGPRTRFVFGYPASMVYTEMILALPWYDRFNDRTSPIAWGSRTQLRARTQALERFDTRVGFDASGFDSSVHPFLINRAFDIITTHVHPSNRALMTPVRQYFVQTPVLMPDGQVYLTWGGVPSGSEWTQPVDCIVVFIAIQYAYYMLTGRLLPLNDLLVLGDDAVFGTNSHLDRAKFSTYLRDLNVTLNTEKTKWARRGEAVHFLGHEWLRGFMTRNDVEMARRLAYLERPDTLRNVHWFTRTVAICLSNDSGVDFLARLFGFRDLQQMYLERIPGPIPLYGLDAARRHSAPSGDGGTMGLMPYTVLRS